MTHIHFETRAGKPSVFYMTPDLGEKRPAQACKVRPRLYAGRSARICAT